MLGLIVWGLAWGAAAGAQMTVTLVGTGGPELTEERPLGAATLVEARGQRLLFDAGCGVLDGLYRAGVELTGPGGSRGVTRVFLTHLHSDHIEGLPGLWMTPWFLLGRTVPMEIWGPVGTKAMVDGMRAMYGHDVVARVNPTARAEGLAVTVHEVRAGVVFEEGGVRVTAIGVEHADGDPAFGYRVETADEAVLLTGDCRLTEGLIAGGSVDEGVGGARRMDVVVSNVAAGTAAIEAMPRWRPVFGKLMPPEGAARLFEETRPRIAVYAHVVKKGLPGAAGDAVIVRRTRAAGYGGPLWMGRDGERIGISGARVRLIEAPAAGRLRDLDGVGVGLKGRRSPAPRRAMR